MCLLLGTNWVSISQKTAFFIVTVVKTSNLINYSIFNTVHSGRCKFTCIEQFYIRYMLFQNNVTALVDAFIALVAPCSLIIAASQTVTRTCRSVRVADAEIGPRVSRQWMSRVCLWQ
jgi:hypothetical protein